MGRWWLVCALACSTPRAPTASATAPGDWSFEVVANPNGAELSVTATFSPRSHTELGIIEGCAPFVRDLTAFDGATPTSVERTQNGWKLGSCEHGCRVDYSYRLHDAAVALADRGLAYVSGDSIEAPPSTFLVRPYVAPSGTRIRLHVTSAPGDAFVAGLLRGDAPDTYVFRTNDVMALPYAAFGKLRVNELAPKDATADVTVAELSPHIVDEAAVRDWATNSVHAVASYYGTLPTSRVLVLVQPTDGDGVGYGSTMGWAGAAVDVTVGRESTHESLQGDWTLVHELVHTALPNLPDDQHWLEEGLASYVEPLARARVGLETPERVWRGFVRGMPFGRPEEGDRGLDRTHTWGRTYWGGALFCLIADLTIRERTHNARSLDDALRAIVREKGTIMTGWTVDHLLDVGDAGTGQTVLKELYARWSNTAEDVDLDAVWRKLGISGPYDHLSFDDSAPMAAVRISMTQKR